MDAPATAVPTTIQHTWSFDGLQRGEPRLGRFAGEGGIEPALRALLTAFGPPGKSDRVHPEYPFWRLQNDGLWEVTSDAPMRPRRSNTDPPVRALRDADARGGLPAPLHRALERCCALRDQPR